MRADPVTQCLSRMKCIAHWGYLGLIVVGLAYHFLYVYLAWPAPVGLIVSSVAVGFVYWFLGAYGWLRIHWARSRGDIAQSNRPIAVILLAAAVWDLISPVAFADLSVATLVPHLLGGALAAVLAAVEFVEDPELREDLAAGRHAGLEAG